MKLLQIGSMLAATTIMTAFPMGKSPSASPNATVEAETNPNSPRPFVPLTEAGDPASTPEKKPADIGLESLRSVPIGTPLEEIRRAADAFGLDFRLYEDDCENRV
jgi:hypothetical protein